MAQIVAHTRRHIVRPNIHITSPFGWLNDPCAPGYDPNTGLYHLFYQCNPYGIDWGNMSWGHATSKDLLIWKYASIHTPLKPDKRYDRAGVFTGCLGPFTHKDELSIFYTSITSLPFHWTKPAPRGNAGLALATSSDDGLTWTKSKSNPILKEEPQGLDVTGFRDPYLAAWPSLDRLRGETSMYGLISGGIQGKGPTSFLYAVDPQNIKWWEYLGPLVDMPLRWQPSEKWDGNYGVNWECVNFMTLQAGDVSKEFLILGSEGDVPREHLDEKNLPPHVPSRTVRAQQWMAGDLVKTDEGFRMKRVSGGFLDHGVYYAANSFADPVFGRRIVYGWIPEEDCTRKHAHNKGWNGCQAFPRELFLQTIPYVGRALRSSLNDISSIEQATDSQGHTKIYTMGVRPIRELDSICSNATHTDTFVAIPPLPSTNGSSYHVTNTRTSTWSLAMTVTIDPRTCTSFNLHIRHSQDVLTRTTVTFSPVHESITVTRANSAPHHPNFNTCDETGPFTLFTTRSQADAEERFEPLNLLVISDGDVLEVFANDRFALATMVYSGDYELNSGISVDAEGGNGCAVVERLEVWDGLNGGQSCVVYEESEEDVDELDED